MAERDEETWPDPIVTACTSGSIAITPALTTKPTFVVCLRLQPRCDFGVAVSKPVQAAWLRKAL